MCLFLSPKDSTFDVFNVARARRSNKFARVKGQFRGVLLWYCNVLWKPCCRPKTTSTVSLVCGRSLPDGAHTVSNIARSNPVVALLLMPCFALIPGQLQPSAGNPVSPETDKSKSNCEPLEKRLGKVKPGNQVFSKTRKVPSFTCFRNWVNWVKLRPNILSWKRKSFAQYYHAVTIMF